MHPATKQVIEAPTIQQVLTLICSKCTRVGVFQGPTQVDARLASQRGGWKERFGKSVCKRCPA